MWKKIERRSEVMALQIGTLLTQDQDGEDIFRLKNINSDSSYITMLHCNGKTGIKHMPAEDLIKNQWWLKSE